VLHRMHYCSGSTSVSSLLAMASFTAETDAEDILVFEEVIFRRLLQKCADALEDDQRCACDPRCHQVRAFVL
jgi:hypothetical protein